MLKILKYLSPGEWLKVFIAFVFIVVQVWADLTIPDYMSQITVLIQTGGEMSEVWRLGIDMALLAFVSLAGAIIVALLASWVSATHSERLRSNLFDKVQSFSPKEINLFSTSSLITRTTNDITNVQMILILAIQLLLKAPIMAIWAINKIAGKGFEWSLTTLIAVVILIIMFAFLMAVVTPKTTKIQTLTDNITRITRENLTGLRVVRAYNAEKYQDDKFEKANKELSDTTIFTNRATGIMTPVMTVMLSGLSLAVYWIGAYMITAADADEKLPIFSDMVVFSSYAMQVIMAFMLLAMIFTMLPRSNVSAKRILEVFDTPLSLFDGTKTEGLKGVKGHIEFKNVSFKYPGGGEGEYVIKDISFTAKQGETVAFIGSTGSGKTTLINLIPRLYDATEGEVLLNGVNVKDYIQESLYNKIGYVSQKAVLFRGTVSSNVAYGNNGTGDAAGGATYTKEEVKKAIAIAQGTAFVEKMEGQYDAAIAQNGTNVSGGQKQRLAIARAICRKPEVYIFDDSFSALDYKTDRVLRSELNKQASGITNLIVAQRVGTIMDADTIIVLDDGKVVGKGTHKELLKDCPVYKEIALSQLSEEELAENE